MERHRPKPSSPSSSPVSTPSRRISAKTDRTEMDCVSKGPSTPSTPQSGRNYSPMLISNLLLILKEQMWNYKPEILSRPFLEVTKLFQLLSFSSYNPYEWLSLSDNVVVKKLRSLTWGQAGFLVMLAFLLYYNDYLGVRSDGPIVKLKQGYLRGTSGISRGGRRYFEFLGIPYASPPVGELRFEPPLPPQGWEGLREATSYGSKCVQVDLLLGLVGGNEDCLFVNVFTPVKPKPRNKAKLLPVIIYVHGGFFHNGGGDFWRPNYFMDNQVVFVTFNYRLNSLGFLNTVDGMVRGNMGLKDQTMVLKWLQENIESFGGDPTRITILGESAGGSSSHLHMYSKMSSGLFNNVISESGSGLHFWSVNKKEKAKEQALRFLRQLGCPYENKPEMIKCLKSANAYDIAEIHRELLDPLREEIAIFKPSVEVHIPDGNTFLAEHPKVLASKGDFNKAPWIFGVNSEEGLITSAAILANTTMAEVAKSNWKLFLERVIWFSSEKDVEVEQIREFYFGKNTALRHPDPFETLDNYTTMISDRGFNYDAHHGARLQSKHAPVYLYYYSYRGEWSAVTYFKEIRGQWPRLVEVAWALAADWARKKIFNEPITSYGASHSDELALLFHMPWVSDITKECKDYQMSVDMIKLWVDFAKQRSSDTTKPSQLTFRGTKWEPVDPSKDPKIRYLRIDTEAEMIDEPFTHRIRFWDSLLANQ